MTDTRLTLRQAAAVLGVSESAIRKRVERGTLRSDKGPDGRRYVYLDNVTDNMADERADTSATPERDALISELRAHNDTLRDQLEAERQAHAEARRIIAGLVERIPAIEAPQEARASTQPVEEEPERAEPQSATEGAQEGTERPQQRSGWLAPVDKLPWWHYVVGLSLVFLGAIFSFSVVERWWGNFPAISVIGVLMGMSVIPGVFGFWVGFRQRNPQLTLYAALPSLAILLTTFYYIIRSSGWGTLNPLADPETSLLVIFLLIFFYGFPPWLLFVSGTSIGNAWQRRRMARISRSIPASPVSHTTPSSGQQPRKDLTPTQQAILGWGGAIIAALISLGGTIILERGGP
jgi:hypothetical protein